MLKPIGLALIFIVCAYTGYEASAIMRHKLRMTEAFISFLTYIKSQIEFFSAPLSDIYESFHHETLDKCRFTDDLRLYGFAPALEKIRYSLPADVYESLTGFLTGLGKSVKQCQIDLCDYHINDLYDKCKALKESLPQKTKLYTSLSVMAGLTAVIILI